VGELPFSLLLTDFIANCGRSRLPQALKSSFNGSFCFRRVFYLLSYETSFRHFQAAEDRPPHVSRNSTSSMFSISAIDNNQLRSMSFTEDDLHEILEASTTHQGKIQPCTRNLPPSGKTTPCENFPPNSASQQSTESLDREVTGHALGDDVTAEISPDIHLAPSSDSGISVGSPKSPEAKTTRRGGFSAKPPHNPECGTTAGAGSPSGDGLLTNKNNSLSTDSLPSSDDGAETSSTIVHGDRRSLQANSDGKTVKAQQTYQSKASITFTKPDINEACNSDTTLRTRVARRSSQVLRLCPGADKKPLSLPSVSEPGGKAQTSNSSAHVREDGPAQGRRKLPDSLSPRVRRQYRGISRRLTGGQVEARDAGLRQLSPTNGERTENRLRVGYDNLCHGSRDRYCPDWALGARHNNGAFAWQTTGRQTGPSHRTCEPYVEPVVPATGGRFNVGEPSRMTKDGLMHVTSKSHWTSSGCDVSEPSTDRSVQQNAPLSRAEEALWKPEQAALPETWV